MGIIATPGTTANDEYLRQQMQQRFAPPPPPTMTSPVPSAAPDLASLIAQSGGKVMPASSSTPDLNDLIKQSGGKSASVPLSEQDSTLGGLARIPGNLWGGIKATAEAPFVNPATGDVDLSNVGQNIVGNLWLKPAVESAQHVSDVAAAHGKTGTATEAAGRALAAVPFAGPWVMGTEGQPGLAERKSAGGILTEGLGTLAAGEMMPKVAKAVGRTAIEPIASAVESIAPKVINIEGVPIKVLAGEGARSSETFGARMQVSAKRQGIRSVKFQEVAREQQHAVSQVINRVAQKTVGDTFSPMPGQSPAESMAAAADVAQSQARPMYEALDASLTSVPDTMTNVSKAVQKAISKAKELGYDIGSTSPEEAAWRQGVEDYHLGPEAAAKLRESMGLGPEQTGTPLTTYLQVRSQMLKALRATADPAMRLKLSNEIGGMNAMVESSLKSAGVPGLYENWIKANQLWTKNYALRSIADSLRSSIEGTPLSEQHPELQPQAPEISGRRMVKELNSLAQERVLQKAFTQDEAKSLRQVADVLDRAQDVRLGEDRLHIGGYSPHSAAWHTITDVIKSMGYAPFIKLATEGGPKTRVLVRFIESQTPTEVIQRERALRQMLGQRLNPQGQASTVTEGPPPPP